MELFPDAEQPEEPKGEEPPVWEGLDLTDLTKRLLAFADALLRRRWWRGNAASSPPGGISAQDLVQIAFEKFESRHHPPGVEPFALLAGIIRGEVAHLVDRSENRHPHVFLADSPAPGLVSASTIADRGQVSPEDQLMLGDWLRRIRRRFRGDEKLVECAELLASDQYDSAEEIADVLGVSRTAVYRMKRRLGRFFRRERGET